MSSDASSMRAESFGSARLVIQGWALFGGFVLVGVVLVNAYSIVAGATIGKPFPGDFELTEMGAAIAAFCFLPYCQLQGAHVSADIFTSRAGPGSVALMSVLASAIAVFFGAILLWKMSEGLQDYREYEEFTGILEIPIWYAFVPALISLALLVVASVITLLESIQTMRNPQAAK